MKTRQSARTVVINYGEEKNNMSRCGCGGSSTTKTKKKKVMTT
jgi:hypothetical protein